MQHSGDRSALSSEARWLGHRYTVKEAAEILGTTVGGVRSRIRSGAMDSLKVRGMVYVFLDLDQSELVEPGQHDRKNGIPLEEPDALLEAKDKTIAELKEQIALLRRELQRKDAILSRTAEGMVELLPTPAPETPGGSQRVTLGVIRNDNGTRDAQEEQEKPKRPTLPHGYRVVATASDAWVLVAPRGLRVAVYRGELDLWRAALDARKHHRRE
jgi:hypothetical protein